MKNQKRITYSFALSSFVTISLVASSSSPAPAEQSAPKLVPVNRPETRITNPRPVDCTPDVMLIMPNSGADKNEIATALQEAHGTVMQTIGSGDMTTLVVQTEKGGLDDFEKKIAKDGEHFSRFQRSVKGTAALTTTSLPNDPSYSIEWYLPALRIPAARKISTGKGVSIAIVDSGCESANTDLNGITYVGLDLLGGTPENRPRGNADYHSTGSHGTCMATAAAAISNNGRLTAGVSDAYIFPIRVATETRTGGVTATTADMCTAIWEAGKRGIRLCSISYGSDPPYTYASTKTHPVLHAWMKWYHDKCNGLVFVPSGNEGKYDYNDLCPYMIMCSGIGSDYKLASFSNYGKSTWFTGPAADIACSDRNGRVVRVNGTSIVPPMIAGIAAMIIAKHPGISNKAIEQALILSCCSGSRCNEYGYGLPNAELALMYASSKGIGDDDEFGQEPTLTGPEAAIETVDAAKLKESSLIPQEPASSKPTFSAQ